MQIPTRLVHILLLSGALGACTDPEPAVGDATPADGPSADVSVAPDVATLDAPATDASVTDATAADASPTDAGTDATPCPTDRSACPLGSTMTWPECDRHCYGGYLFADHQSGPAAPQSEPTGLRVAGGRAFWATFDGYGAVLSTRPGSGFTTHHEALDTDFTPLPCREFTRFTADATHLFLNGACGALLRKPLTTPATDPVDELTPGTFRDLEVDDVNIYAIRDDGALVRSTKEGQQPAVLAPSALEVALTSTHIVYRTSSGYTALAKADPGTPIPLLTSSSGVFAVDDATLFVMTVGSSSATIARVTLATGAARPSLVVAGNIRDFGGIAAHEGHVYLMEDPPYDDLTTDPGGPSFDTEQLILTRLDPAGGALGIDITLVVSGIAVASDDTVYYTQPDNSGEPGDEGGVFEVVFERP